MVTLVSLPFWMATLTGRPGLARWVLGTVMTAGWSAGEEGGALDGADCETELSFPAGDSAGPPRLEPPFLLVQAERARVRATPPTAAPSHLRRDVRRRPVPTRCIYPLRTFGPTRPARCRILRRRRADSSVSPSAPTIRRKTHQDG